jgi:hypothetical protein
MRTPKPVQVLAQEDFGRIVPSFRYQPGNLPLGAAGQQDDPFRVFLEMLGSRLGFWRLLM